MAGRVHEGVKGCAILNLHHLLSVREALGPEALRRVWVQANHYSWEPYICGDDLEPRILVVAVVVPVPLLVDLDLHVSVIKDVQKVRALEAAAAGSPAVPYRRLCFTQQLGEAANQLVDDVVLGSHLELGLAGLQGGKAAPADAQTATAVSGCRPHVVDGASLALAAVAAAVPDTVVEAGSCRSAAIRILAAVAAAVHGAISEAGNRPLNAVRLRATGSTTVPDAVVVAVNRPLGAILLLASALTTVLEAPVVAV